MEILFQINKLLFTLTQTVPVKEIPRNPLLFFCAINEFRQCQCNSELTKIKFNLIHLWYRNKNKGMITCKNVISTELNITLQ